jgi:hypothetical protein
MKGFDVSGVEILGSVTRVLVWFGAETLPYVLKSALTGSSGCVGVQCVWPGSIWTIVSGCGWYYSKVGGWFLLCAYFPVAFSSFKMDKLTIKATPRGFILYALFR